MIMKQDLSVCPKFERAFQIIGKKWNGLIIEVLLTGECHFSTIADAIPELSDRMLAARLRELETLGIVTRLVDTGYPVQVTYRLTEKGREIRPVLAEVHHWADKWFVSSNDNAGIN
jgi:Predicted transcriptional regulators